MKTIENVTLYKCDFCGKKMQRKHAMIEHEKKCSHNPLNKRKCLEFCENLVRVEIFVEPSVQTYTQSDELVKSSCFKCKAKNIFMYSPKIEHSNRGVPDYVLHNEKEIIQEPMPLHCDLFDNYLKPFF